LPAREPRDPDGLVDHTLQPLQVEGFEQIIVGSLLHHLDGVVGRTGHGDEDDGDPGIDRPDLPEDFQAGLVRQAEVEENDVGWLEADAFNAFGARGRMLRAVLRRGEYVPDLVGHDVEIVVDQK
jgi:hypothetical protein